MDKEENVTQQAFDDVKKTLEDPNLTSEALEKNMEKIEGAINTIHTNVAHVCENMTKNLEATKKVMETMNSLMETFVIHNILVRTTLTQKSKEIVGMDIIVSNLTSFALKDLVLRLCDTHGSTFDNMVIIAENQTSQSFQTEPFNLNAGEFIKYHIDIQPTAFPFAKDFVIKVSLPSPSNNEKLLENTYYTSCLIMNH